MEQEHNRRSGDRVSRKAAWSMVATILTVVIAAGAVCSYLGDNRYAKKDDVATLKTDIALIKQSVINIEKALEK